MALADRDVLPGNVKPVNYGLHLHNLELGGTFSFQGKINVEVNIKSATKRIVLNAHQLTLKVAELSGRKAVDFLYAEKEQRVTLVFATEIPATQGALLYVEYKGTMNSSMAGFYRSKYKPIIPPAKSVAMDGEHHCMFSTQFESSDARRAFPCFDEPNLKATFDVSIELPTDQVALSNMPIKWEIEDEKSGLKVVHFDRTPVMSTYLLAWSIGDFEYVENFTQRKYNGKNLPVRVYTTRGLEEQGRFGVDVCCRVVDYYSNIFTCEFPLPKLDMLAVHAFSHNAMENWGLITYRTTAILFDPKTSDAKYKNRVAYVVAHELAHQWFGNLVTMDWWSELWLNEGFATWVGWLAVDHLYPEHECWSQFVAEAMQTAQNLDSLRSSHAVEVPVKDALQVEQIFDAISYLKGCSVIRMLVAHLGLSSFLNGVSVYLREHAYSNATTRDLWAALSRESGKDVNAFMDPWIRKIGFPVLTVADEPGQISVHQSRFLSTGDVRPEEDEILWWIPLGLKTDAHSQGLDSVNLTTKENTLRNIDETFYKLNIDQVGFYRTNYPAARLAKLGGQKNQFSVEDRIGLVADAAALAVSGHSRTAGLLSLVENFKDETSYAVWSQIVTSLGNARSVFSDNESVSKGLATFTLQLVAPATEKIGWDYKSNESYLTGQLRALLIGAAGGSGHEMTIYEAKREFKEYTTGNVEAIHPNLRLAVYRIAIEQGGEQEYKAVRNEFASTKTIDGKEICLLSLGRVQTKNLVDDFLDFQFSNEVALQDIHAGSVSLAANVKAWDALWAYIQQNWEKVSEKLSINPVVLDRYIKTTLSKFSSHKMEQEISSFFKDKDTEAYDRGLIQVSDSVRANANYKERDEQLVLEWLKAHGYL